MSEDKFEKRRLRLLQLRDDACGGSNAELSRRIGKDATYVSRLLYPPGKTGKKNITEGMQEAIESAFRLPKDWLDGVEANAKPAPPITGRVPLISWVQAGDWCEAADPYPVGAAEEWLSWSSSHSARAFCLRVKGPSMMPDYRDGEIILVEPDELAQHGDDVVIRTPDGNATFKRLQITPDGTFLLALNPDWRPRIIEIPADSRVCGVVIESRIDRRRR